MRKLTKILALTFLALTSTSMNEEQMIYLTGVELIEKDNNVYISGRYSVVKANENECIFSFTRKLGDQPYVTCSVWDLKTQALADNVPFGGTSSGISIYSLQAENKFKVYMCPLGGSGNREEKEVIYRPRGKTEITFAEKDNGIGVETGFYKEFYNCVDASMNYTLIDKIIFDNFEDEMYDQVYNFIDISHLRFKYTNGKEFNNMNSISARLDFYDKYNHFPEFPQLDGSMYRYYNLNVISDDNGYLRFIAKDPLYYHPMTHEASLTKKDGYVETDKLYLPLNAYSDLKQLHCRLHLEIEGNKTFKANGEFDINFKRKIFGDCQDSEYCTHIYEDDSVNVYEKEVVVNI